MCALQCRTCTFDAAELKDLRSSLEGEIHSTVSVDTETNLQAQTSAQFHPSKK